MKRSSIVVQVTPCGPFNSRGTGCEAGRSKSASMHDTPLPAQSLCSNGEPAHELRPRNAPDDSHPPLVNARAKDAPIPTALGLLYLVRTSRRSRRPHSGIGEAIDLVRRLLQIRPLRKAWQRVRRARKRRYALSYMDKRLMKDIGLPPE